MYGTKRSKSKYSRINIFESFVPYFKKYLISVPSLSEILTNKFTTGGISKTYVAAELGVTERTIENYMHGKRSPKPDVLVRLSALLGFNLSELSEQNVPRATPYIEKRAALKNGDSDKTLLYYEVGAAAGNVAEILPVKKSEGVLHISDLFKGSQYAIRISGNSMTPNYPSGAIIGIREIPDKQITPGSVYVVEKDSDLWIKRLYYKNEDQAAGIFQCVSDNTMVQETGARAGKLYYPMFEIEMDRVRRLFKVTGIYKANELTLIN